MIIRDFDQVKLSYVYHERNMVVDILANIGASFPTKKEWDINDKIPTDL